jgi:hypothetical protein
VVCGALLSVVVPAPVVPLAALALPEMLPVVLSGGRVVVLDPLEPVAPLTPPVVPCVPVVDWLLSVELPTAPEALPVSFSAVLFDFLCFLEWWCFLCLVVVVVLLVVD